MTQPTMSMMYSTPSSINPATAVWVVTSEERQNYDLQFEKMMPQNGFVSGNQAKNFFLQSNLPPQVLGQIWCLADLTNDGRMDRLEFAIAMKLIKLTLQGTPLPAILPATMKVSPILNAAPGLHNSPMGSTHSLDGMSSNGTDPNSLSRKNSLKDSNMTTRSPSQEWGIPKQVKLKYNQLFNSNDRAKSGFLTGVQARHLLSGTGLAQMVLAQVWQLSDLDKDGKLTQEEFVLAMYLTDTLKAGSPLPTVLPAHLIPPSHRSTPPNVVSTAAPPAQLAPTLGPQPTSLDTLSKDSVFASFEDKRRENFQKGNLELEKRRQALLEREQKDRERKEKKEREEQEKREKERLEQERKKQEEMKRQVEAQIAAEREREEQRRKAQAQKEAAQREMERQRQLEWERARRKELLQQKLREQESVTTLRAKTKTLDVELKSLEEKKAQLQGREAELEKRKTDQQQQLAAYNQKREELQTTLQQRQQQLQQLRLMVTSLMPEKRSLTQQLEYKQNGSNEHVEGLRRDVEQQNKIVQQLKLDQQQMDELKASTANQYEQINTNLDLMRGELHRMELEAENLERVRGDKSRELDEAKRELVMRKNSIERKMKKASMKAVAQELAMAQKVKAEAAVKAEEEVPLGQRQAEEDEIRKQKLEDEAKRKKAEEEAEVRRKIAEMQLERKKQKQTTTTAATEQPPFKFKISQDPAHLCSYRALYNFIARNPDELSLQVGDVVTVDESQDAEPDWLAGSKQGKAGWFPANYVEKIQTAKPVTTNKNAASDLIENGKKEVAPAPIAKSDPPAAVAVETSTSTSKIQNSSQKSAFLPPPASSSSTSPANNQPVVQVQPVASQAQYRSLFPWIAKKDNHLSFEKDEIITVTEMQEMWWFGTCKGKTGWFPKSFVKELKSTTPVPNQQQPPASPKTSPLVKRKAPQPPVAATRKKSLAPALSSKLAPPTPQPPLTQQQHNEYVASYDFAGTEPGDLSFSAGDVITVSDTEGEWWKGQLNGAIGIFPANYVTKKVPSAAAKSDESAAVSGGKPEVAKVIAEYQATSSEQLSLAVGQLVSVRKKSDRGWWEGVLQARGKKRQSGWFPANYVKLMSNNRSNTPTTAASASPTPQQQQNKLPATKEKTRVTAMYDYQAQNADELTFKQGQVIMVHARDNADWWTGVLETDQSPSAQPKYFPSNYVQQSSASSSTGSKMAAGGEYYRRVMELISSEETYLKDLELADQEFQQPLRMTKLLSEAEITTLFVNLNELVMCSAKMVRAFRVRCSSLHQQRAPITIGDILCQQLPNLHPYIRFCSCQLNASAFLQEKLDSSPEFKAFVKSRESGDQWKGLPVSSYLVKPMQRVTKYPLLIKKILEHTPDDFGDKPTMKVALEKAEELCHQVNEGVRQKENSDRLEWIQSHVQLEGLQDALVFNSKTNCLGQRRFLHCGILYKHKSNKELVCFLFSDFLLLTTALKPLQSPVNDLMFSAKGSGPNFRLYKEPVFLNEVLTRLPSDLGDSGEAIFHLSHIESIYAFRCETVNERTAWMKKIAEASALYIDTEKKKREKAYQARTQRNMGIGRLMISIVEGCNLTKTNNHHHQPYCKVAMGDQCNTTKTVQDTLNPKWGSSMQFFVRDLQRDVLCISILHKDMFSPDAFLGRTEVKLIDIHREMKQRPSSSKGPISKRLLLQQVEAGEVVVKIDLLLFEQQQLLPPQLVS